jgi:ferritin-like protein
LKPFPILSPVTNRDQWDDNDQGGEPCTCGRHCAERDYQGNPRRGPRAFCDTDRGYIRRAVRDLPETYVQLHGLLPRSMAQQEHVSGSREAPVPLNVTVEAFMRQLVHVTRSWEREVRAAASLSALTAARDGTWLAEACKRLAGEGRDNDGYLDTLVGLAPSVQRRFVPPSRRLGDLEPGTTVRIDLAGDAWHDTTMDGAQAGLEFLALNGRARGMIGLTRQRRRITEVPCDGCRARTLVQAEAKAGGWEPVIRCTACPTSYVGAAYDLLVGRVYRAQLEALGRAS